MFTTVTPPNGRGCGQRFEEAPYACCGSSPFGAPVESFVVDPAIPWPGEFQRGVKILPRNPRVPDSVNDLVIFVGKKYYESPWDFVEEVSHFGASRKIPHNLPFEQLTPKESRMIFAHSRVIPHFDYEANRERPYYGCRCFFDENGVFNAPLWKEARPGWHEPYPDPCTHALRDLAYLVHGDISRDESGNNITYTVNMPSFSYNAKYPKTYIPTKGRWGVGIFLALPLTHIEYCRKADEKSKANAEAAGFETVVMEH